MNTNAVNITEKYNNFNTLKNEPVMLMSATSDNTEQYNTQSDILSGISKEMLQEFNNETLSAPENMFLKNLESHHMSITIFNIL
ncbi:MAG TPA: hypothetical protein PL163_20890, partial [Leptospiraceae bacterium]|nr:hypothetical protein [Leptospiraceae bacterium]